MEKSIEKKLIKADATFIKWKKTSFKERQKLLVNLGEELRKNAEKYAELITNEMNKPISQSLSEIEKCAVMCDYYSKIKNVLKPEKIKTEFKTSEVLFQPKGVILGVMPWNYPFWQVLRFAVPTILAGNTVVLKHANICFGSGNAIQKIFEMAGFPKGVFINLEIEHQDVAEIINHNVVKAVSITGSELAGANVASTAGKTVKKSLLELGGSDAFIVLDDADLKTAASVGAFSRLQNCGQTCIAAKRFILHKKIEKDFLTKFIKEYKTYVPGHKLDKNTKITGMAKANLADNLLKQYQKAIKNGAEILIPLERISDTEFNPGLISVKLGNPILNEELFGPLAMVMVAKNDDDALKIANAVPFGLGNSIWSKSKKRQKYFIENLESGTVSINKMTSSDPRLPFGGIKKSGYGVELSLFTLKEFVNIKTIVGT